MTKLLDEQSDKSVASTFQPLHTSFAGSFIPSHTSNAGPLTLPLGAAVTPTPSVHYGAAGNHSAAGCITPQQSWSLKILDFSCVF
jgi:hypothetical protein